MKNSNRTKSEPVLYRSCSSPDLLPDSVGGCQTVCNGTDNHTFHVNGENGSTPSDVCDDDGTQYVALDCEFVGVGPKQLSALGMRTSYFWSCDTAIIWQFVKNDFRKFSKWCELGSWNIFDIAYGKLSVYYCAVQFALLESSVQPANQCSLIV